MPTLRQAPEKFFKKTIVSKGYGYHTPQDGSVCKIKVIADDANLLTGLDDMQTKEIIVGDVDESIDRIVEDCIRTMKEEEECCVHFEHPDGCDESFNPTNLSEDIKELDSCNVSDTPGTDISNDLVASSENSNPLLADSSENNLELSDKVSPTEVIVKSPSSEIDTSVIKDKEVDINTVSDAPESENNNKLNTSSKKEVKIQFQLLSYTREPEVWEMSITEKWRRASYHKQRGLELYARGAYQYAFRRFGLTLKYVISLEHDVPSGQEEGMDIKGLKLSCYLNVAACQMRHHNFESVVINSTKALAIQPSNAKALYRRGAAYLQLQEYEKSKEDLTAAQQLEPKNQAISKQLQVLKSRVQKLNQFYASAMKKMFS